MECPKCKLKNNKVIDKRWVPLKKEIRRRRECLSCGFRFTTYEVMIQEAQA